MNNNNIEQEVYDLAIKIITIKQFQIYDKEFKFDTDHNQYYGHIKYFGNSTVDICLEHDIKTKKFYISLFLDTDYSEDGNQECLIMDKNEVKAELLELLLFLKTHQIKYSFNWD